MKGMRGALTALCLLRAIASTLADFNLLISRQEMNRTLGVSAEMNYVQNGAVNAYSTRFPYRVASNVTNLKFTWSSPSRVAYSVHVMADDFNVLPSVKLPNTGRIPEFPQDFYVDYRCAGSRAGQFLVTLTFNVSFPTAAEPTIFSLKQEKICTSRDGRRALAGGNDYDSNLSAIDNFPFLSNTLLAAITVSLVIILLLFTSGAVCLYSRAKKKNGSRFYSGESRVGRSTPSPLLPKDGSSMDTTSQPFSQPCTSTPYKSPMANHLRGLSPASTSKDPQQPKVIFDRRTPVDINRALVELYADRNLFQVMPFVEMEGTFGEVKWAIWRQNQVGLSGDIDDEEDGVNEEVAVICKTLKTTTDRSHFEKFIREALAFHQVPPHINLAQVIGVATFGHFNNPASVTDFPLISYRHQGFGFLKKFLNTCRGIQTGSESGSSLHTKRGQGAQHQTLRTHDLVSMAQQVAKAIGHLHSFGVIHRDVATRNCLIAEIPVLGPNDRLVVQLCDAALSRDLFPDDYHTPNGSDDTHSRPVKWMSPESIRSNVYNSASDVWSFGVLMWELFTCGQQPFGECNAEEMTSILQTGTRLGQPYNCPDEVYNIMNSCWVAGPLDRPTASQLQSQMEEFGRQLRKYI